MSKLVKCWLFLAVVWTCLLFAEPRWYRAFIVLVYWALFFFGDDDET